MSTADEQQDIIAVDNKHATYPNEKTSVSPVVAPVDTDSEPTTGPSGFISQTRQSLSDLFSIVSFATNCKTLFPFPAILLTARILSSLPALP
jgi:hypothetical protein